MKVSSILLIVLAFLGVGSGAVAAAVNSYGVRHFEEHIRPVLIQECVKCHGEEKQKGGLRLDSQEALLRGGDSGPVVEPGAPDSSLIVSALRYEDLEMPPEEPLPSDVVQQFEHWIRSGAPWPEASPVLRSETEKISPQDREWWAFQPVRKVTPPAATKVVGQNPIDRFTHARLNDQSLQPAPRANEDVLLRRLYFDVLGVPPSPEEAGAYRMDSRIDRWRRLVDRLLSDPRYGEHWSRYWLDLVRYSDSDGWNQDAFRPHIWRYRDYVIDAFNQDKSYRDFVREQLAGDELPGDNPVALTATGFLRLGIYEYNQRDARGHWNDIMNEMTDVAGDVFFGISMACARCHDHKFDPVLQQDYFRLRSFFEPIIWRDDLVAANEKEKEAHEQKLKDWNAATEGVRTKIDALLKPYYARKWETTVDKFPLDIQACFRRSIEQRDSLDHQMAYLVSRQFLEEGGGPLSDLSKEDHARHEELLAELKTFDHLKPEPLPKIMAATDFSGTLSPTQIPGGESVIPNYIGVLADPDDQIAIEQSVRGSGRRTALANWIASDSNPLTARVIVNRIWQQHFGEGLVTTPNDFGHNGKRPTHPELLDWLTAEFIESDWHFKGLHRLILSSETWKQSSQHPNSQAQEAIDPDESFLWRHRVRRLKAEQIRDAMLSVSGEMIRKVGGGSRNENEPYRALYVKQFRNRNDTLLHAFDLGGGTKPVPVRNTTTTPTQALLMINGDYVLARANEFAARLRRMNLPDPRSIIREAILLAWNRAPKPSEVEASLAFLNEATTVENSSHDRLVDFCHVLFNSNEFLYLN